MNRLILDALKDIGAPVAFEEYTGKEPTYVRFFYLPQIQFSTDDKEKYTTHYVQVDIFSPVNLTQLSNNVKNKMSQAGFRKNYEVDKYEEDTKLYHKLLRFWITKEAN